MKLFYIPLIVLFLAGCGSRSEDSPATENNTNGAADTLSNPDIRVISKKPALYFPEYAADGKGLYLTGANYKGLWYLDRVNDSIQAITDADKSGYEYTADKSGNLYFISGSFKDDVRRYEYRFNTYSTTKKESETHFISSKILNGINLIDDRTVSFFIGDSLVFYDNEKEKFISGPVSDYYIPRIFGNKLAIYTKKEVIETEPFGGANIIYVDKSPINNNLLLYAAGKGLYEYKENGSLSYLGDYQKAVYSHNGKMIAFFIEENDGHRITGSDIFAVYLSSPAEIYNLTKTADRIEMNPAWSAGSNKIICNTIDGEIIEIQLNITEKEKADE